MPSALNQYLRSDRPNGFTPRLKRAICALLLALLLPLAASAYTIVLRGGRRIEIPAQFTLTKLTLTYEASPGINITLLISSVDIEATERANREPAGSFLKRVEAQQATMSCQARGTRPARRELTKEDIETARRARELSNQAYERRRQELGLPSLEEARRRTAEETKRLGEVARQSSLEEAQAESYWRSRATQLRTEMATLDAQITYLRARLAEIPETPALGTYGFMTGVAPSYPSRHASARFPAVTGNPGFMRADVTGVQTAGRIGFGNRPRGLIQLNIGHAPRAYGRRGSYVAPGVIAPYFGVPYTNYDYSMERGQLVLRLHELETMRSGFQARWRLLEEEARRAGAMPGWLRP